MARIIDKKSSLQEQRRVQLLPTGARLCGPVSTQEAIDKELESYRARALACLKARRFAEARAEFAQAFLLLRQAQRTNAGFALSLPVVTGLAYPYGALLIRLEDFAAAERYLTEARQCLQQFEARALFKGRQQVRQYCRVTRGGVDLECAYLALRQRAYTEAIDQATRLYARLERGKEAPAFRRLRANTLLVIGHAHYVQRHYKEAHARAVRALALEPSQEDAETLFSLAHARLLSTEGKYTDALTVALAGCRRFVQRLKIECIAEATCSTQVQTLVQAIQAARQNPQIWRGVMPDEREQIGEFLVILGMLLHARAHTADALQLFLLAGALLPQAEVIAIPEFEHLTRALGARALREPLAFVTLETLLTHPLVRSRWEFLEAVLEAIGRTPLSPALACVAALKAALPPSLPPDTRALVEEIQADLENAVGIAGHTAAMLGLRVLSDTSARFVVRAPFPREGLDVVVNLIIAIAHHWKLATIGMADPQPSTPATEALTDAVEEGLIQRSLTGRE